MEIVELQNLGATTGNREHIKTLKRKTATLADLLGARVQGALVRSRFQSASEMDAPSKFFFGLEQKNIQRRFMHAVRTESGDLLSEPAEIRKRTVGFFSKLYNSEHSGAPELEESFLHKLPTLTRQSAEMLDRAFRPQFGRPHRAAQQADQQAGSGGASVAEAAAASGPDRWAVPACAAVSDGVTGPCAELVIA
ncbi:hypothetical protein NFI96_006349 [Prochilodus magdalenae]|nr:hypothetical protein NFI96_006349 [Prochilodus magdalenae]